MTRSRLLAGVLAVAGVTSTPVHAQVCSITSVTGVAFGSYDVFDEAPVLSSGSLTYTCSSVELTDSVVIELGGLSTIAMRTMISGTSSLSYGLFLDAARTLLWGTGAGGTSTYGPVLPAEGTPTIVPIYGRLSARQDVAAGAYGDTVVVTVKF